MKVEIIGQTDRKLTLVKYIKTVADIGLKEAKEIVDYSIEHNKSIVINVVSYDEAVKLFYEENLNLYGLKIRRYRVDTIQKLLRENDPEYKIENEDDYPKYLEAFNFLYKNDKHNFREIIHNGLQEYKNKKIKEYLHLDKQEASKIIDEIDKFKI